MTSNTIFVAADNPAKIQMIQPSAFKETNNCPALLNPASSCTISVTYTAASGTDFAQLAIVTDPNQTRYTAFLSGYGGNSAIASSTSYVQFGSQFVGAAPLGRMLNFTNTTPYTTSITGISTSAGFAQTNTCTKALAPHASCRVLVTYAPATNQDSIGTLTAGSLGPGGGQSVGLYGTGLIVSDLAFSPMPLSLYSVVNEPPSHGVITLTNTGRSALKLLGFQLSSPFSQTNNCPTSLGVGSSCDLTIAFKPTQSGVFNQNVSITNSGQNSPQIVPLIGTAQTLLTVDPTVLDYGQQKVHTGLLGYLGLGNGVGYETVTVSSITVQGTDFKLTKNGCPSKFPPFTGCADVEITFSPSATGLRTGTATIMASDLSSPHVATLQGIGVSNGQGTLSATSLNFGSRPDGGQTPPQTVTLTNTGSGALKLSTIAASSKFTDTSTCGASLAVGAKCTISIVFAPSLKGMLVGSLSVQDDGAGSPHTVALTGIGK